MVARIITVTSKAASHDIILLATVKTELGITDSSDDVKLQRLIGVLGAELSGPEGLQRPPWLQTYQIQIPGEGGRYLRMPRWPIVRVSLLQEGVQSPVTVVAADYSVANPVRDRIYRENGWARSYIGLFSGDSSPPLEYTIAGVMGWLMPGVLAAWQATTAYASGAWARAVSGYLRGDLIFEVTTAGTSAGSEPTWPTADAGTVTDGTVVWTARIAEELPEDLQEVTLLTVIDWFRGGMQIPSGIKRERSEQMDIEYVGESSGFRLPSYARHVVMRYR